MAKVLDPVKFYQALYLQGPDLALTIDGEKLALGPKPGLAFETKSQVLASLLCGDLSFKDLYFLGLVQCPEEDLSPLTRLFPGGFTIHNNADF